MKEREIQLKFAEDWMDELKKLFGENLRLYAFEFPIKTNDGIKYADLVFELTDSKTPMDNKMIIIELKRDKIDIGAVDQVLRYSNFAKRQLYRKKKITSVIAGPDFSKWEIQTCKDNGVFPLQYDLSGNMRLI